jgi:hypothetical protein
MHARHLDKFPAEHRARVSAFLRGAFAAPLN